MTTIDFSNYSVSMETAVTELDEKITQFIQLCQQLRAENIQMRQSILNLQAENKDLHKKIKTAKEQLQSLLEKIPAD